MISRFHMKSKNFSLAVRVFVVLIFAMGTGALAQAPTPKHFSGILNDFTPATISGKVVGPWEIRGPWSLDLKGESGQVNFSPAVTMELTDLAVAEGVAQVDVPASRASHTHHITMTNATIS